MSTPALPIEARATPSQHPANDVLVFDNVAISFEDKVVLDGISFRLPRGETKAIFGVAGSGKSTMLKMALGLLKPDSGHIYTLGQDVTHMREEDLFDLRRKLGIVFQESALFDSLTVRDNVAYGLMEEGTVPPDEIERRVREALRFVELENTVDMFPAELSGGMRRRVAIARAIITQPDTILYDSPTGGLDPVTSTTIVELLIKQRDVSKTSSLLVTHRLQDAFTMATHYFDTKTNQVRPVPAGGRIEAPMAFLMLRDGKIIFDGNLEQLVHSQDEYIREYIS
jgi:phospholipid/cholesterol/gamma-HCH transport system ATP-binding protein